MPRLYLPEGGGGSTVEYLSDKLHFISIRILRKIANHLIIYFPFSY